jgi:hypothetical protein
MSFPQLPHDLLRRGQLRPTTDQLAEPRRLHCCPP